MGFTFSVGDIASYIQAVCTVFGLIASIITLIILYFYARDTKTLANSSVDQVEQGYIPYLNVQDVRLLGPQGWRVTTFTNIGKGPAINITIDCWTYVHEDPNSGKTAFQLGTKRLLDMPVLEQREEKWRLHPNKDLVVSYYSLSGQRYETIVTPGPGPFKPPTIRFRRVGKA